MHGLQIIIPIAGKGERFIREGYEEIKPLIDVGGKPMIQHACEIFPVTEKFIFICSREHKDGTALEKTLKKIRPNSKIIWIEPHKKGPVWSVLAAKNEIDDKEETIVSYGDFTVKWDYEKFLQFCRSKKADAALPVFRGFQPAQFTGTKYAYVRTDAGMRILEIREKEHFTDDKTKEFASVGIHYFKTGELMKDCFAEAVKQNLSLNGEFYASLPFNVLVKQGKAVFAYEVEKFICFGTPTDVKMYNYWQRYFSGKG